MTRNTGPTPEDVAEAVRRFQAELERDADAIAEVIGTSTTVSKTGAGIPPTRRTREPRPEPAAGWLEATVVYNDGRSAIEHYERNDGPGVRLMDRWALRRNEDPRVDYIAVERVSRKAKETGRGTYR